MPSRLAHNKRKSLKLKSRLCRAKCVCLREAYFAANAGCFCGALPAFFLLSFFPGSVMTLACPQKMMSATHWGLCRPVVEAGVLRDVLPFEGDFMPSPNLSRLAAWVNAKRRIAAPCVRRGFLEKGSSTRAGRGRDDFVEVSWERALGLAAQHIARVYEDRGAAAVYGKTSGWKSCGLLHSPIHLVRRLLNLCGGFVPVSGTYSTGAVSAILPQLQHPEQYFELNLHL